MLWREWTFTLWGKNLLNERYEKRVFFFGNEDPEYIVDACYEDRADPRQLGVSALACVSKARARAGRRI